MTKKRIAFAFISLAVLLGLGSPLSAFQNVTIRRDVTVAAGESQDNVIAIGGSITIDGRVRQSVIAIGGTITVSGEVGDDVVGIGSRMLIKSKAVIKGDVVTLGGGLEKEPGCAIQGDTVYVKPSDIGAKLFRGNVFEGLFSLSLVPLILAVKLTVFFVWLMLALLGVALFPKPIAFAAGELRKSFWTAFAIGLLAHIVFFGLVLFAVLLSIVLIGIPVLLALVSAALIIKAFGRLVLLVFIGESLLHAFGSRKMSAIGAVLAGLLVVTLIGFLPVLGFLFGFVINMAGWGIIIRTKFGTTENMFLKKPGVTPAPAAPAA
jgi:hypothetical protein